MNTPTFDLIASHGNRRNLPGKVWPDCIEQEFNNRITCVDGFSLSVIAGTGTYCSPKPPLIPNLPSFIDEHSDRYYTGPYTHVEVGFPSDRPEPWDKWSKYWDGEEPVESVYPYVPVELVRELIESHGGEK